MNEAPALDRLTAVEYEVGKLIAEHERTTARDWSEYRDEPVRFLREVLHFEPWSKQIEVAESALHHKQTAVRGDHGAGKEAVLGALALWYTYARNMLVLCVSATERQLIAQLWTEIARLWRRVPAFDGKLYVGELRRNDEKRIIAMTSGSVSNLSGYHNTYGGGTAVLISESQAEQVGNAAFDALLGNTAFEGSRIVVVGNPIDPQGRFYEACRSPAWNRIRMSAFDHPNIKEGRVVIPGGPAPDWPKKVAAEFPEDHPFYVSRVLAEFPSVSSATALPPEAVEAAVARWRAHEIDTSGAPYILGCDPAFSGDEFAVCVWHGPVVDAFHVRRKLEADEACDWIIDIMRNLRAGPMAQWGGSDVAGIYIDKIGVGATMPGLLRKALKSNPYEWPSVTVEGVNIAQTPGDPKRFVRRKCELIWALREALVEDRIAIPPDAKLIEEMRELRVHQTSNGLIEAEQKGDMSRRLGRSPDRLDALLLGMSPTVPDGGSPLVFWSR